MFIVIPGCFWIACALWQAVLSLIIFTCGAVYIGTKLNTIGDWCESVSADISKGLFNW